MDIILNNNPIILLLEKHTISNETITKIQQEIEKEKTLTKISNKITMKQKIDKDINDIIEKLINKENINTHELREKYDNDTYISLIIKIRATLLQRGNHWKLESKQINYIKHYYLRLLT